MDAVAIITACLLAIVIGTYMQERYADRAGRKREALYVGIGVAALLGAACIVVVATAALVRAVSS